MKKENNEESETTIESNNEIENIENIEVEPVVEVIDPYQASLEYEETVVKKRSETEDQELFGLICKQLKGLMKEVLRLKTEKPEGWASEVESKKVKGLMLMLSLRRFSRIQKVRVKNSREQTAEFRQTVDAITLQLENLLYEVSHLKKEVRKCLEFQSADAEIDLVPIDQFYKEAPESISRPEETVENPHQQRLAQLHWELEQRRGQTQMSDKLTQEKDKVADMIAEQEAKLASLAPRIEAILEATLPLQKSLNLPLDAKREQQRTAHFLPAPLYTLWVQACAYSEACNSSIQADIVGDVDAAKKLSSLDEDARTEASDSEAEVDAGEENAQRKSRSGREKKSAERDDVTSGGAEEAGVRPLLALHPLYVAITLETKEGNSVQIEFHFAQVLRIVTVKCSLDVTRASKPLLIDVLDPESFLTDLFPNDAGSSSPNPANEYQLRRAGASRALSQDQLRALGRPFKWAQTLAGLSFMPCEWPGAPTDGPPRSGTPAEHGERTSTAHNDPDGCRAAETVSWKLSAEHMHHTLTAVERRLRARLALHLQLATLEDAKATSAIPVPPGLLTQLFPGKVCSELKSWRPITWEDYEASSATDAFRKAGVVDEQFLTFKALFQRDSVYLFAYVAISPDYPNVPPVFALHLSWNRDSTAASNPHVREMESEVNTRLSEFVQSRGDRLRVLSVQLFRLAVCLDILTEAVSTHVGDPGPAFHKEKIFFRTARGPDRALPFKYLPKLGVFAQR